MSVTRLVAPGDAEALAELLRVNRDFFAPWGPARSADYLTVSGQRAVIELALAQHQRGLTVPHVILADSGRVAGRITLNEIVRGPFQSCSLGYWLNADDNGRGLAAAAVREIIRLAFDELGLHRIQAATTSDNVRSQRVLDRTGFTRIGLAPAYLEIAGRWQDHVLYQVVNSRPG